METEAEIRAKHDGELQKIYLKGIDDDQDVPLKIHVEQARLALYGSIVVAGGAMTAAWSGTKAPCMPALQTGMVLLFLAVGLSWNALQWAGIFRTLRSVRKYAQYFDAKAKSFANGPSAGEEAAELTKAEKAERRADQLSRWMLVGAYILGTLGAAVIISGALDSIAQRACWVWTVWPLIRLN